MDDNTIWVSGYWQFAYVAVWFFLSIGIAAYLDIKINGDAGYGPADSFVAGIPCVFIGLVLGTVIFFVLMWIEGWVETAVFGLRIGFRS